MNSYRMGDHVYIVMYALGGQTGETAFLFNDSPLNISSQSPDVTHTISSSSTTLNYLLHGSNFVNITFRNKSVVVMILDKETALQWHAVDIPGQGVFKDYFSIGTNNR